VASDFDRDNSIDALLKGARRDPAPASNVEAGPACLDAETLAAWADGGLDADRVRVIEAHVADCSRCHSLSAAFFSSDQTAAANGPKVVPFRRNRVMYWVPIAAGTIAATLVIWLGVRDQNALTSEAQAVITESRAAQAPAPATADSRLQDKQQGQQGNLAAAADATRLERKESAPVEQRADRAKKEAATANRSRAVAAEPAAPQPTAAPPPPPPAIVPPPTATTASGVAGGVVGGTGGGVRQASELLEKVEPRVVAEFSSVLAQSSTIGGLPAAARVAGGVAGGGVGRGGGGAGGRGAAVALDAAVAPPFYWRILVTDVIERSVDRLVWEAVAIDPPVRGLSGGAAPSATVCWIIGRAGLVLLTTDGKEFTRLTQPAPADLISITATDALRATVTTVGGQAFTTTDGGKSWK
jgi:hypothetical protein